MSAEQGLVGTPYEGGVVDDRSFGLDGEDIRERYAYSKRVIEKLNNMGLGLQPKPVVDEDMSRIIGTLKSGEYYDGRLPQSIRKLSIDDLSDLHILVSNWMHYIVSILNDVTVKRSEAAARKSALWSMVRIQHLKNTKLNLGTSLSDQRQSDITRYDLRFVDEEKVYQELTALRDCIEASLKVAEMNASVVSREVTRRELQLQAQLRSDSLEEKQQQQQDFYERQQSKVSRFRSGNTYEARETKAKTQRKATMPRPTRGVGIKKT